MKTLGLVWLYLVIILGSLFLCGCGNPQQQTKPTTTVVPKATAAVTPSITAQGSATTTVTTKNTQETRTAQTTTQEANKGNSNAKMRVGKAGSVVQRRGDTHIEDKGLGKNWLSLLQSNRTLLVAVVALIFVVGISTIVGLQIWLAYSKPSGPAAESALWRSIGMSMVVGTVVLVLLTTIAAFISAL